MPRPKRWTDDVLAEVLRRRQAEASIAELAAEHNVKPATIRAALKHARKAAGLHWPLQPLWTVPRLRKLLEARDEGKTLATLGAENGCTPARISALCRRARKYFDAPRCPY